MKLSTTGRAAVLAVGFAASALAPGAGLAQALDPASLAIQEPPLVELRNERYANSEYDEFSPVLYGEGVVFVSARKPSEARQVLVDEDHGTNFTSIFFAPADRRTSELTGVSTFDKGFNRVFHDATPTFTPDGNTVYFTRSHSRGRRRIEGEDGYMYLSIYRSDKAGEEWSKPAPIGFSSRQTDEMHPALSADGTRMYFTSNRPGGFGGMDIWSVDVEEGGWGKPRNLGPQVNGPDDEAFPFVGADGVLYLGSDRPGGIGGYDLYRAAPTGRGGYEVPENLGEPYNSEGDDTGYVSPDEGLTGYFSSNRTGGQGGDDLYGFTMSPSPAKAPSGTLLVHVEGERDLVIEGARVKLVGTGEPILPDGDGRRKVYAITDEGGTSPLYLDQGLAYDYEVMCTGYVADSGSLAFDPATLSAVITMRALHAKPGDDPAADTTYLADGAEFEITAERLRAGNVIELPNIFYDFDSDAIRADARADLDSLALAMARFPTLRIELRSHTDSRGTVSYNRDLAVRRAASARDYLVALGVDAARVETVGFGESQPLVACPANRPCTELHHQTNRRTEARVISIEGAEHVEIKEGSPEPEVIDAAPARESRR